MPSSTWRRGSGEAHERWRVLALWTGILAGPIAWLMLLQFNYSFGYVACETRQKWFLHLAIAVAAILVAAAGWWAWRAGRAPFELENSFTPPIGPGTCVSRSTWMAWTAAFSTIWFLLVILAMEVPTAVLKVCQ